MNPTLRASTSRNDDDDQTTIPIVEEPDDTISLNNNPNPNRQYFEFLNQVIGGKLGLLAVAITRLAENGRSYQLLRNMIDPNASVISLTAEFDEILATLKASLYIWIKRSVIEEVRAAKVLTTGVLMISACEKLWQLCKTIVGVKNLHLENKEHLENMKEKAESLKIKVDELKQLLDSCKSTINSGGRLSERDIFKFQNRIETARQIYHETMTLFHKVGFKINGNIQLLKSDQTFNTIGATTGVIMAVGYVSEAIFAKASLFMFVGKLAAVGLSTGFSLFSFTQIFVTKKELDQLREQLREIEAFNAAIDALNGKVNEFLRIIESHLNDDDDESDLRIRGEDICGMIENIPQLPSIEYGPIN